LDKAELNASPAVMSAPHIQFYMMEYAPTLGPPLKQAWQAEGVSGADKRLTFYELLVRYKIKPVDLGLTEIEAGRILNGELTIDP